MFQCYSQNPVEQENLLLLNLISPGDAIQIPTESHTHYGIYVGYGNMIHLAAIKSGKAGCYVIDILEESYLSVAKDNMAYVYNDERYTKLDKADIVSRAKSQLGSRPFDIKFQCCKQFVDWCIFGDEAVSSLPRNPSGYAQLIKCHNFNVLRSLEPGDIVEVKRPLYSHMCIYVGNYRVVHVSGNDTRGFAVSGVQLLNAPHNTDVKEETFYQAANGCVTRKANDDTDKKRPLPTEEIVRRARSKLGKIPYQALHKNCEHFVNYCRYGIEESSQSRTFFGAVVLGSAVGGFFLGGPVGAVAATSFSAYKLLRHASQNTPDKNKK